MKIFLCKYYLNDEVYDEILQYVNSIIIKRNYSAFIHFKQLLFLLNEF